MKKLQITNMDTELEQKIYHTLIDNLPNDDNFINVVNRFLRKRGITIRKTADVIIATFCIENQHPLLFSDKDFIPFVNHLGLIQVSTS